MGRGYKLLEICAQCQSPTWCFPTETGPICAACRAENFFNYVLYRPLGYVLLPWIRKEIRAIYSPVDIDTGLRKITRVYEETPKKNSKSTFGSGFPLLHLAVEADEIDKPEAYGAASAKDQAGIVFRSAAEFVKASPELSDRLKVLPATKRIVRKDGHGVYQVLSADGDVQDGIANSFFVRDEIHRWKTAKAKTLYDILSAGDVNRDESLGIDLTTAGDVYESPICYAAHERARRFMDGSFKSDSYHGRIFAINEEKLKDNPDYWTTREARVEANPSHEDNVGGFLKDAKITAKLEELGESGYKRYHLNVWGQKVDRWMPMGAWLKCGDEQKTLVDRECWLGLDLSSTTAMTALVAVFPDVDGTFDILSNAWIPEQRLSALEKRVHQPLREWITSGKLETTPGPTINLDMIRKRIDDWAEQFNIKDICYDPWNADKFIQELEGAGYRCIKIKQGFQDLSAPMKYVMGKVLEGKIRHGDHPVMNWHMDCVTAYADRNGNLMPDRSREEKEGKRIDLASALINAFSRYIRIAKTKKPLSLMGVSA